MSAVLVPRGQSRSVGGGPARKRFEDLLALPVELWRDEQHIRRVRFSPEEGIGQSSETSSSGTLGCRSTASTGRGYRRCARLMKLPSDCRREQLLCASVACVSQMSRQTP
jgi:hypothetical protein